MGCSVSLCSQSSEGGAHQKGRGGRRGRARQRGHGGHSSSGGGAHDDWEGEEGDCEEEEE